MSVIDAVIDKHLARVSLSTGPHAGGHRKPIETAFIYVVERKPNTNKARVLLQGHKRTSGRRVWGPPGGHVDAKDDSRKHGAVREFFEEMLGQKHISALQARGYLALLEQVGDLYEFNKSSHHSDFILKVDNALRFEAFVGLKSRKSRVEKYRLDLSNETRGYIWSPLPLPLVPNVKLAMFPPESLDSLKLGLLHLREGVIQPCADIAKMLGVK
jgi:8-oxo-dGTP pyrophosphatase MutT (NUDIX family)